MNSRMATLLARTNYTADKTEVIDIDVVDPVSRLTITYEPDNNPSGINAVGHPAKCISKIELVDGSDVLYSLTGQEAQGVDFYDNNRVPPNILCYLNGIYSEQIFNMNFGRHLFDPEYALVPGQFKNTQLKITIDINGGGDDANDGYLTVIGHLFDEKAVSPLGFIMTKEIKDYPLAASSHLYTDLPTDHVYRQLFLRAQVYASGPEAIIDTIKLSEDVDKRIPLNHSVYQILRNMCQEWNPYVEWLLCQAIAADIKVYITPTYWPVAATSGWSADAPNAYTRLFVGDGGEALAQASVAGRNIAAMIQGWAPHAMIPLLPKPGLLPEDWYDVTGIKNLKLDTLTTASGGSTQSAQIVVQQLRKY